MPYYDFDEEERRRREQEAIRDAYFQEWRRRNNSANAPKVKAADRREMAAANIQPVMYNGNVNPNNDQLPAMTTAEMAARQQARYMQQVAPAADAASAMLQNAPVDQYMMRRFLPNISNNIENAFAQAAKIDPNAKPAEPEPIANIGTYTSALDQAKLIKDQLFTPKKDTTKPRQSTLQGTNVPDGGTGSSAVNNPRQSALQGMNVPDGGNKVPNYALKEPGQDTRTATEKELGKANTTVNGLSEDAQRDLTKIIGMQADYDVLTNTAPAYGAMLDRASLQRREDAKKALDAAEAKFKKDYGVSDEEYLKLKDYRQRITNAEYNQNQQKEMQQSFNTGNALKDYANIGLYTVGSTLNYPVRGGEALLDIVAQGKNKDSDLGVDIYGKGFNQTNLTNNIRQAAAERIGNGVLGETGSNLYQTGASIADSIYGGALAGAVVPQLEVGNKVANWFANKGVQALGMAPTIGASAAATAYQDARNRGLDEKHAEATAITSGLIEVATESFSLDNLFDVAKGSSRLLRKPLIQLLASSGIEGSEEWASEGLNAVADWLINKGESEYEQAVAAYKESGMSDADARHQAKVDVLHDANDAFKWGAIAGFVPGAATTVIGTNQITKQARQIYGGENMDYEALGKSIVTDESRYENKSAAKSAKKAYDLTQKLNEQQKNGGEASDKDLRNLFWNLQDAAVTETEARDGDESRINPSVEVYDALPEIVTRKMEDDKIKQYNAADKDLTAEDVTKKMAKAKTAQELVSIRKQAENSEYETVRKAAQDAYEVNQGRIMSQNEDQNAEAFEAAEAMPTTKDAFNAGLENGTLDPNASREAQIAFREGRMINIARASRQNVSEDIKGTAVSENDQSALTGEIKLAGKEIKAVTDNGTVSIEEIADPAVKALYRNAAEQGTEAAAQVYLDNYATNMPIGRYTNAFDRYSVAGATNTMQFEDMYNRDTLLQKWMTKDQLQAIYDFGAQEAAQQKLENAERQNDAIAVRGTGKVVDLTKNGTDQSLLNMIGAMAKATQKDYVITDQAAQNINGYFNRSMQRVVLNAKNADMLMNTLFHEGFGEVLKAHNAEGYHKVQQSIMDYLSESPSGFQSSIKNYQAAYKDVEGKKALYDAASEMINDSIAGLFSTEEGIKDFSKWADSKYSQQEKKTLFQNIADYFQKLVDSFHDMLDRSRLSDPARRAARMGAKRAAEIRQTILAEMDIATANAAELEVDESLKNEDDISYSLTKDRNDEYDGGIRYSIDTTAEALNLTFEKEGNLTVLRDQDGKKITRMTPSMVRNTPLGGMINSGIKNGFISEQNAKDEYQFVSDLVNQMLKTQDLDMVFAVNSVLGFQELQSGARPDWTKNPMKSKNAGYVSNSDPQYSSTVDFTTICVKSQAIIDVMSATMKKLGRGLTSDEITKIVYKNTHEAGEPVPCPVCYVFSRWVGLGGLFDNMKNLQERYADADVKQIRADMAELDKRIADTQQKLDGSKKTKGKAKEKLYKELKEEYDKLHKVINAEKLGGKVLLSKEQRNRHDLLEKQIGLLDDWTWLQKVRLSKNYKPVPLDVLFDINAGTRFANEYPESWTYRTTRGPAMGKAATPYADEHLGQIVRGISSPSSLKNLGDLVKDPFLFSKKKGELVETVVGGQLSANASRMITNAIKKARVQNLLNGQRMQSTSDFRFEYALDYLLGLYELQSVGAKVQMYTKVPESVGFLASAGAEINLSMMPFENGYEMDEDGNPVYDENGNLKLLFSDVTGMHPDDAFRLSSMYDNVQPIVVGTNNIFIRGLLADPRITFIIPYHASGSNEGRYVDMMRAVGENVKSRQDYSAYQTDTENKDATPAQKAAYDLRTDIVTGKAKKLSAAEKAILADNPVLHQLYQRFYGVDVNGNTARIENKYLDSADRGANGYGTVDHNTLNTFLTASQAKTIMPYEFWDKTLTIDQADRNGDAFRSYCESLGLHPRFTGWTDKGKYEAEQDFSKDSGYWKMLPDRAMYNRDGTYHEQQAINVSNMRLDYLDRAKTVEGITKPSVENDRNKVEMIAQKSVEDINRKGNSDTKDIDRIMDEGSDIRYSVKVTDQDSIDFLENQEHIKTYRSFQVIDGGLYAPMAAIDYEVDENGKKRGKRLGYRSEIGQWEQATEAIDVARTNFANGKKAKDKNTGIEYAKFDLEGGDNQTGGVAYNPYLHSSNVVLNDQFAAAYRRNLVVVECEVPASELTSGYRAELAKDPTGWREWKSGAVAGEIAKQKAGFERQVFLSRWMKPVRILDDAEVASMYKEYLDGTKDIKVPWNVVTPSLRHELQKQGVPIDYSDRKFGSTVRSFAEAFPNENIRYSVKFDTEGRELSKGQQDFFKDSKLRDENGALKVMYHGSPTGGFTIFNPNITDDSSSLFFTDSKDLAKTYSGNEYEDTYVPDRPMTFKQLTENIEFYSGGDWSIRKEGNEYLINEGNEYSDTVFDSLMDAQKYVLDNFANSSIEGYPANYEVYLNIENPYIVDAEGNEWFEIPDRGDVWLSRDIAQYAKENGYDGVIINNVIDSGDRGTYEENNPHTVAVVFDSNRVKSVDNRNPTENNDIRYSLGNDFVDFTEMDMFQPDENGEFAEEEMASILTEGAEALRNTPIDKGVIDKIAKKMTKFYGSSYSAQDLSDNLEKVFSYAAEYDIDNAKDLARIVKEVAMPVIETAERKTGGEELKAAKKALSGFKLDLTDRQRQEVMRAFGSYVNYKRAMKKLGVTIAANGSSMDGMWTSLADALPGTLPVDAVEGDMPLILYDQLSGLGSRIDNGFGMDNEEAAQDLALKIMSEYYSEMGKQEGLKKADREILKAQAQRSKETMSEYRLRLQNEYDARYNAEYADLKKRFDDKTAKKLADIQAKSKARAQKSRDAADARYQKDQIRKSAEKLLNMLYHPNKKKHVPAQLQDTVIDLLSALDFVGPKIERLPDGRYQTKIPVPGVNGQKHFETYTGDSYMEVMNKYQEAFRNGQGTKSYQDWKTKLSAVTKLYSESKTAVESGDNVSDFQMLLKADLGEALERVIEENNGRTSVNSLGSEDLKVLNKVIKNIYTAISNIDKSYSMPEEVSEIGNSVIERGAKMKSKGDRLKVSKLISRFMRMDNATPETFFHGMGAAGDKIYKALFEAQNQKARFEREDRKFMDTIFERVPVKTIQSWTDNNSPVIYEDGDFKLRVDQVMTLYEIAKRQSTQAHMYEGFKAGTVSVGKLGLKEHVDEKAHILTKAKINEITSHLTQDQKWVADQLQQYMATVGSKRGNDQTLKIYGYEMFTEPDYFPAQVDQTTVQTNAKNASTEGNVNGVLNAGFTNEIKPKATNTLILNSIFDVYLNHMNEVNTYASHAGILTDINRINNYKVKEDVTVEKQKFGVTHTVKQALDNIYGQEGKSYLVQFLKDINQQEMATKTGAGVLAALTKNFKSAATLGNLRVVGQQPTAWCRALILIDPKYMAEGLAPNKAAAKLQEETSMISWIKDNGNISGLTTQSQRAQVLGLQTRKEKINELTGWLAGKADSVTWAALYRAVYAEQKDKFKGKTDSEEFKKAVNDRFDEVIARTQVVDGTLMRSQMMRSGDRMNMNFSAFMAEPTKTYNMFLRQFNDMTYEKRMTGKIPRKAWETMSRIIAAHIITQLVNALPQSIMDAARDEDDETTYAEKFLANLGINVDDDATALEKAFTAVEGNFISNLGVIGKLPVLSTINDNYVWPWIEKLVWGEDAYTSGVTNNDFQALNAIDLALKGTVFKSEKSKLTTYGSAARVVNAISMALGVPVYGLMRDTVAAYNTFNDLWGGENIRRTAPTSAQLVKPVFDSIDTGSDYKAAIEKAVEKGSKYETIETNITKQYKQQYIDLMREGKTEEASKLENRLMMIYDYLQEQEGQKPSSRKRVQKWYTDWAKENGIEQIELTGGTESSGSRMTNMTNVESMDVPISEEPANIWGNAYVTRQPRGTSYWVNGTSDWEKEHHTNAARMIQETFAHGYDPSQPYENDFRRNSEWHMKQINKRNYARKKTYGSGGGNAVAWKSPE